MGRMRNASAALLRVALTASLAGLLGGCALTMQLASFQDDPETTATTTRASSPLDPILDDEDWRRAQAALALAVDPQGSGQPVNWDNPATKRKGTFAAAGNLVLIDNTVCRPFTATIWQAGPPREIKKTGEACRLGPGEWAMRQPALAETTAKSRPGQPGAAALAFQPLPAPTSSMLDSSEEAR